METVNMYSKEDIIENITRVINVMNENMITARVMNDKITATIAAAKAKEAIAAAKAKELLPAVKKAKELFEKEPDNPMVNDTIDLAVEFVTLYCEYLLPAIESIKYDLDLAETHKDQTGNIKPMTKVIKKLIFLLKLTAL